MRKIKVFTVDAFTEKPFKGNPAGVVLVNDEELTDEEMQSIAKEIKASETAFIMKTDNKNAHYRVKYFTPSLEIDFCGHATLSAGWVLVSLHLNENNKPLLFETNVGIIPIDYEFEEGILNRVIMTQVNPQVKPFDGDKKEICEILGLKENDLDLRYPLKLAYTGIWCLLVPVKTREAIDKAKPDFKALCEHNLKLGLAGTHLFTFNSEDPKFLLYTRDFSPSSGVDEDPVTGSASGALAGYLSIEKIISQTKYQVLQGNSLNRFGEVSINILNEKGKMKIQVGGKATIMIDGYMNI